MVSELRSLDMTTQQFLEENQVPFTVDADSGQPLPDALIALQGPQDIDARSDQAGAFRFTDLQRGHYRVEISRSGYRTLILNTVLETGDKRDLGEIRLDVRATDPDTGEPVTTGLIRGQVTDRRSGAPLSGATIALAGGTSVITGADGRYLLDEVAAHLDPDRRIALFEADDNQPLALWRRHAEARGQWDARCALYPALDLDALERAFEAAESDGCDIALVDTRGGGSEFNQTILLNAALIVVPTNLSSIEVDEALQTLRYVIELMRSAGELRPLGLAINRVTPGRLSAGERDGLEILKTLPIFEARLSSRRVFADLKGLGHLHLPPLPHPRH